MFIPSFDNEEPNPTRSGGNADVFQGTHNGRRVAIKVLRVTLRDLEEHTRVSPFVCLNYGI